MKLVLSILLSLHIFAEIRVISTSPAITQTLSALDLQEEIIGQSNFDNLHGIPKIGTSLELNLEKIIELKPDFVFLDDIKSSDKTYQQLKSLKINVHSLKLKNYEELKKSIIELGSLLQKKQNAEQLIIRLDTKMTPKPASGKKAIFIFDQRVTHGKVQLLFYLGSDTFHGEILSSAGYQNILKTNSSVPTLSIEKLGSLAPDIIFVLYEKNSPQEYYLQTPLLKNQNLKFVQFNQALIYGPKLIGLKEKLID